MYCVVCLGVGCIVCLGVSCVACLGVGCVVYDLLCTVDLGVGCVACLGVPFGNPFLYQIEPVLLEVGFLAAVVYYLVHLLDCVCTGCSAYLCSDVVLCHDCMCLLTLLLIWMTIADHYF